MMDERQKIERALEQHPDYSRLDDLSADVWKRVRENRMSESGGLHFPVGFKMGTVALCLIAVLAVSQVLFQRDGFKADLFDLRFFSHQADPSLNFASVNTYEFTP